MGDIEYSELSATIGDLLVLDVRNHNELEQDGQIPGSRNVPMKELEEALGLSEQEFSAKYGFQMPASDANIVTHCNKGGRARKAMELLNEKGFKATRVYAGSFTDWKAQGGEVVPGAPFKPLSPEQIIKYSELSATIGDLLVLDVRNHRELVRDGQIPGSRNVPMVELEEALDLSEEEFCANYGFQKPSSDANIVTHCNKGGRAKKAMELLNEKGFKARVYAGSFTDWKAQGGEVVPGTPFNQLSPEQSIEYSELSATIGDLLVLDVRNHRELERDGQIPGSRNVPNKELEEALGLSEEEFSAKYGFQKPGSDANIVTHCHKGARSRKAMELLNAKGYKARVYAGSFSDWKAQGGEVVPGTPYTHPS